MKRTLSSLRTNSSLSIENDYSLATCICRVNNSCTFLTKLLLVLNFSIFKYFVSLFIEWSYPVSMVTYILRSSMLVS